MPMTMGSILSRPCLSGLRMRPRRLFGFDGTTDADPRSPTGSITPGAFGPAPATAPARIADPAIRLRSLCALRRKALSPQAGRGEFIHPHRRAIDHLGRKPPGLLQVIEDDADVALVRLEAEVEEIADERHRADHGVDRDVADHAGELPGRQAELLRLPDDVARQRRRDRLADHRDESEQRVDADGAVRARDRDRAVQHVRQERDPRNGIGDVRAALLQRLEDRLHAGRGRHRAPRRAARASIRNAGAIWAFRERLQGAYSIRTTMLSVAPLASITETRAKPAPSGLQVDCRRSIDAVTGAPLTSQVRGGTPPAAFKASGVASPARAKPSSTREPSRG